MSDLACRAFQRICIIKPSSPGDIIHALPVLRGLRRRYPDAHLAWLVATSFANLIEADPALDEIIPFDRRRFGRIGRSLAVMRDFLRFIRELRQRRFDLIIDLQGLLRSGFLAAASGAKHRIGPREAREFAWMFYNQRIPRGDPNAHAAARNYAVAEMLGFPDGPLDFSIALTHEDRQHAVLLLAQAGLPAEGPYVVLVPATRWETKCWPVERYGRLAGMIRQKHGLASILVGGASDIDAGQNAADASDGAAHNLCGKTTLRQLAALIDRAALVVTADSTPMHVAAAHGRPLVALFGPTNPNRTGPYGRLDDVLRLELDCSPCYLRKISQCPHQHRCMNDMTLEKVARAIDERLAQTRVSI
jgi:lipopolysaccharide heptosyltransferase I